MNPDYFRARFLTSAGTLSQAPLDEGSEVAFAGRSNAGKSSAINLICNQRNLARTSKTPGHTRLLNFFAIDDRRRLVDLPGYGYAKLPLHIKRSWQDLITEYLLRRESLRGLILVMDIRHPLQDYDLQLLHWTGHHGLSTHILLTKADKLNNGPASAAALRVKRELSHVDERISVQLFSALKRIGVGETHAVLDRWFRPESS